jgi:hypothetical protein
VSDIEQPGTASGQSATEQIPGAAAEPTTNPDATTGAGPEDTGAGEQPGDIPFEQAAAEHENPALG